MYVFLFALKDYTERLRCMSEGGIAELLQWKYAHPLIVSIPISVQASPSHDEIMSFLRLCLTEDSSRLVLG